MSCSKKLIGLFALASPLLMAQPGMDSNDLLDKSEYRGDLEEVIVTGSKPEWREQPKPEWRADKFELKQSSSEPQREWFPEYTKEDRENYDGVRDRMGEKAEIKVFKWGF